MILDNEFTGDPRVENEVISLQKAGHEVFVLCFNYGNKKDMEDFHGAKIIRKRIPLQVKKKLNALNNTIINLYPIYWKNIIIPFVKNYNVNALHVHDLWLVDAALRAKKKIQIPITLDLHENFPSALRHYKYSTTFPLKYLISPEKWDKDEKTWSSKVDSIIVVIEEAKERLINLGIRDDKIHVVANYVNISEFTKNDKELTKALKAKYQQNKTLVYTGGFDQHRGLDYVIKATAIIINKIPDFKLVLVGGGKIENQLKELARSLKVEGFIDFAGYRPHAELSSYIEACNLCIIPHLKSLHTDNTIPHKLFQYMLMEKPVIASNCNPLERILKESKAGVVYPNDNPEVLAEEIINLFQNEERMRELGKKGKEAVLSKYNWTETSKNLTSLYKN